jgi:DNA-directed RNA polymerase specialized sigma24 family protein
MPAQALHPRRRADDILARDYERLRHGVLRGIRASLHNQNLHPDLDDLSEYYNTAWHALHSALLDGENINNPEGFLVKVGVCRGIDEARRARERLRDATADIAELGNERDLDEELDRHTLLRHFSEGIKEKLTERECQAAALCLLRGYSRPEAARELGVTPKQMERIMDDAQQKIGSFLTTITDGSWCDAHESMLRAYAFGLLDVNGERYRLASAHLAACPGCRRFVNSLRNLAAVLPPVVLPVSLSGGPGEMLAHLNDLVGHAWRHNIELIGRHVVATKSATAAGAGAGSGAGHAAGAGAGLFGAGAGKLVALCATICAVAGAGVLVGTHRPVHQAPSRTTRPAQLSSSAASAASISFPQPGAPLINPSTARAPHAAHDSGASHPPVAGRRSHQQSASEFSFEAAPSPSTSTPPTPAAPSTQQQTTTAQAAPSSTSSKSSDSSEFSFEGP